MTDKMIKVGQIYQEVTAPRREWRLVEIRHQIYVLERVDKPSTTRFPDRDTLLNPRRYHLCRQG